MANWRTLATKLALSRGRVIDPKRAQIIKEALLADGKIDESECAFLVRLRRDAQAVDPVLDDLCFAAIKSALLKDGYISAEETKWLQRLFPSGGEMDEREKQFLRDLKHSSDHHCKAFLSWCHSIGMGAPEGAKKHSKRKMLAMAFMRLIRDSEGETRWLHTMIASLALVCLVGVATGAYFFVTRVWFDPQAPVNARNLAANREEQKDEPSLDRRGLGGRTEEEPLPSSVKGNLHLVAVGVSKYKDAKYNLGVAHADAEKLAETCRNQCKSLFKEVTCRVLTDEKATRENIIEELANLRAHQKVTQHDLVIVTLSGHGGTYFENDQDYFFSPHDYDGNKTRSSVVNFEDFKGSLKNLPCPILLVLDTCHSGAAARQVGGRSVSEQKKTVDRTMAGLHRSWGQDNNIILMTACLADETAQEKKEWGHGALSLALREGLSGKHLVKEKAVTPIPTGHGEGRIINLQDLDYYVTNRVEELTGGKQAVNTKHDIPLQRISIASLGAEAPKSTP